MLEEYINIFMKKQYYSMELNNMKLLIIFFLYAISINAQPINFIFQHPNTHVINTSLIQYHYNKKKEHIASLKPIKRVKLTFSSGLNGKNFIEKVNVDDLKDGDFKDAFNDIETIDYIGLVKYDFRTKVYLTKRWRTIARIQFLGLGKSIYTIGAMWKL